MKNNKIKLIMYISLIVLAVILIFLPKLGNMSILSRYNDYLDHGIIDGFQGEVIIYKLKLLIALIILILNVVVTFVKNNLGKLKYVFFVIITILTLLVPLGYHKYSGGFAGITAQDNIYVWNLPKYVFK